MSGDHADTYAFPFNCFPSGLFLWKTTSPYSICSNIWLFFQISDKHRIQPQFLADFLRIWVSQEEERKYICPDLPWRKSASGAFFVPGLFFFKDDEKSSNVSRAHSTHSTCLTNGLWADLRACKPNISMDQRVRFPSTKIWNNCRITSSNQCISSQQLLA